MKPRRLSQVAWAVGGALAGEDVTVSSVAVDSREVAGGALFFALRGERADGHAFVADAFARGATAAAVREAEGVLGPLVVVEDVEEALLALAADERAVSPARLIGITGSTGKTSTKDLAAAVLGTRFRVAASPGSYNNEIGLPLTLLGADDGTEVIVAEMGSRGAGHITRLAEAARPDVGVVTNIGVAHLEQFGSKDGIAEAKSELIKALPERGVAILPTDDPLASGFARLTGASVLTFGTSVRADVRADDVSLDEDGCASFSLTVGVERERVELSVPGEHMVSNALAAAACGVALGMAAGECAAGLKGARISAWRMETFTNPAGIRIVNDAYNANPESMAAALKAARWMARETRMVAVLGRMAELGTAALQEHERVGELAARLRVERLITVGSEARPIAAAAVREGVEPENVVGYDDPEAALEDVLAWARPGDVVLFKASRVVGLERLAEAMR